MSPESPAGTLPDGPLCGCVGCHTPAGLVIRHSEHGQRVVCDSHAAGHEVIGDV